MFRHSLTFYNFFCTLHGCFLAGCSAVGSACRSGRRGRGFKSRQPDKEDLFICFGLRERSEHSSRIHCGASPASPTKKIFLFVLV